MKDGTYTSPFAVLSSPVTKKVPIYCWVYRQSFPVVEFQPQTHELFCTLTKPHQPIDYDPLYISFQLPFYLIILLASNVIFKILPIQKIFLSFVHLTEQMNLVHSFALAKSKLKTSKSLSRELTRTLIFLLTKISGT